MNSQDTLAAFEAHLRARKLSPITIESRLELLERLSRSLSPTELLDAAPADLERWQQGLARLSRATVDIYSRHVFALYKWAVATDQITADPTRRMVVVAPRKGVPHPIDEADLRTALACARGGLRLAYVLAAFAGLRCGEITRLRIEDLALRGTQPTALINGKGGRERVVPLLPPVVAELGPIVERARRGVIVTRPDGTPFTPDQLSAASYRFLRDIFVDSTIHSMRHYFATTIVHMTKDVLLVRDLLGHSSVATTQIYLQSSIDGAQDRLAAFSAGASALLSNNRLTVAG